MYSKNTLLTLAHLAAGPAENVSYMPPELGSVCLSNNAVRDERSGRAPEPLVSVGQGCTRSGRVDLNIQSGARHNRPPGQHCFERAYRQSFISLLQLDETSQRVAHTHRDPGTFSKDWEFRVRVILWLNCRNQRARALFTYRKRRAQPPQTAAYRSGAPCSSRSLR